MLYILVPDSAIMERNSICSVLAKHALLAEAE